MKEWNRIYNPFNPRKLAYHIKYWEPILDEIVPPPILVTLDPINKCNLNCSYCNAAARLNSSSSEYTDYIIDNVGQFLSKWGTKAVCVAGGGEPLLHRRTSDLINNLVNNGLEVGVVTNGVFINKHEAALSKCRWVGISVDAGSNTSFTNLKGRGAATFDQVINNIECLHLFSPQLEITYKFLAHPLNISDIYEAVRLAKKIGCRFFHMRPTGNSWDNLNQANIFTSLHIALASAHIEQARLDFEDENFSVFGVVHKFSEDWGIRHDFKKCYATAMTAVIQPNNTIGLCCDRRGDPKLDLGTFIKLEDIINLWGSAQHINLMRSINLHDCPRCTYEPHNQLFEQMACSDATCKNFI